MARKPRVHFPGAFYHVISRGNQGHLIFHDNVDRERYLLLLQEVRTKYGWKLYACVLMGNHVHLLVEVGGVPLSKVMQNLQFRYTRYYNHRYRKIGHLFQGRYKAILCDRESYLTLRISAKWFVMNSAWDRSERLREKKAEKLVNSGGLLESWWLKRRGIDW